MLEDVRDAGGVGGRRAKRDTKNLVGVVVFDGDVFRARRFVAINSDRAIKLADLFFSKEFEVVLHKRFFWFTSDSQLDIGGWQRRVRVERIRVGLRLQR